MFLIGIEVRIVFSVAQNIILYLQLVTVYLLPSGGKEHGFTVDEIEFLHYGDHVWSWKHQNADVPGSIIL